MNGTQVGAKLVQWTIEFTVMVCWATIKTAAMLSAKAVPKAQSRSAAGRNAVLVGGAWVFGCGLLGAATLNPSVMFLGCLVGSAVGGVAGYATLSRGLADAAAAGGAIELGERRGVLGAPTAHTIPRASRVRHVAVFGATGSGKSTVLKNIALQDAAAPSRPGFLCIDIKDDFALSLMDSLPPGRQADVIVFDPSDRDFPPAFNPLADILPEERTLATAELLGALKRPSTPTPGDRGWSTCCGMCSSPWWRRPMPRCWTFPACSPMKPSAPGPSVTSPMTRSDASGRPSTARSSAATGRWPMSSPCSISYPSSSTPTCATSSVIPIKASISARP